MPRLRRWTKRLGFVLLGLFAVLTLASVAYNAATAGGVKPATELEAGPFVAVDGKLVAFRRWGARGTPIVLLGGFIVPSSVWDGVGARLGRDHRVFALDLPPFGYTERRVPYTLRGWIDLVRAFETRFDLHHSVLVGHSLGAAVVVADALWHPADPKGIVLLDGDAISAGGAPSWVDKLLVGPWFTSVYRIATTSDWIFRRGLAGAYPGHPPLTPKFLEDWERPFKVHGTLGAFRAMLPWSSTMIWSASRTVESRCAIAIVVRPSESRSSASWTRRSVSVSSELVASSSTRIGGLRSIVRAIAMRCFSPPENR